MNSDIGHLRSPQNHAAPSRVKGPEPSKIIEDSHGVLYGTTAAGGQMEGRDYGCGTVFKLTPSGDIQVRWKKVTLHIFTGEPDGAVPYGDLVAITKADGKFALIGATIKGGAYNNGAIFEIVP